MYDNSDIQPITWATFVYGKKTAVAIDAGAVNEIISFAKKAGVTIKSVTNTHSHYDHTSGNASILEQTNADFLDCKSLKHEKYIEIDGEKLEIFHSPGHMDDCITFKAYNCLITGGTLFNGTVGNCFSGDMKGFLESIKLLMSFPPETIIYSGHDYVREAIAFTKTIDKDNAELDAYLAKRNPYHVVSSIADELEVNPFVRFNDEKIISILKEKGLSRNSEYNRWKSVFELY